MQENDQLDEGNADSGGDTITSLEYSPTGEYLATGDRNGRLTVLRLDMNAKALRGQETWLPYFQFQSHEPEFDFLKSLEIESKINQIKFCQPTGTNNFILSANDKTIKLWRIGPQRRFHCNAVSSLSSQRRLVLPQRYDSTGEDNTGIYQGSRDADDAVTVDSLQAINKRVYANAHAYHINSLALSTDNETFFSADDLRVNWWRLDASDTAFNLIDIKPENMEELTEVITAVQCHPVMCNLLIYSSSRGSIKICDTRLSAICSSYPRVYSDQTATAVSKSFITDILNSISDVSYSADGRYIISRDYLTIKIWDVNMERRPVKTIALHDYLRPMLYDLYTSDTIFDKFEVCCSADGRSVATGSYSNQLKVFHQDGRGLRNVDLPQTLENGGSLNGSSRPGGVGHGFNDRITVQDAEDVAKNAADRSRATPTSSRGKNGQTTSSSNGASTLTTHSPTEVRLDEKVLHCAWHPVSNTIAVAGKVGLCLYKV